MAVPGKKLSAGTGNEWVGDVLSEQRTAVSDQEANPLRFSPNRAC